MEVAKENQLQLVVSRPTASYQEVLDSQKEIFRSQIDQLQNIVATQCKLTGVNPLSQEMAAGALSIKIGKRPRDLLNPKAIKYMQSVFSIKDAISKKESREISARFGVTATQVREFFNGQRSRVRRFVRLSREKVIRSIACEGVQEEPSCSDPSIPINPVPLNCMGPSSTEGPSCSSQDEVLPGIDESDKHFVDNIFSLMRKEETFSGQLKLMEWILQMQNSSVLYWFLTKGGVMILATWLSQAAIEEQTSVLHVILKVLCHLPLHKALPVHMSAILQSVNRLRFYRTSDISNRARILLSRWSKVFARSQALRRPNATRSLTDAQDEMLLKQSIGEIMGNDSWESKVDTLEETHAPSYESSENFRKLESSQPLKLLTSFAVRGVSASQTRERRKVLLVEQPGQKTAGRSPQVARSVPATQGRPLSADDIQKAKMRAQFMQSKYGKPVTSSDESPQVKTEGQSMCSSSQASILLSASEAHVWPKVDEHKRPLKLLSTVSNPLDAPLDNKMSLDPEGPSWKKYKGVQIPWQKPPEMRVSSASSVGTGENSKEIEVQKNRIRREKEIIYMTVQEIPSDPKEPWDREMDYDDTLTPGIPTEQLPDVDGAQPIVSPCESGEIAVTSASTASHNSNGGMAEPDLELLAVLLKNPELVFALTSDQGGNLSSEETVKLLDMIKANGVSSLGSFTGLGRKAEEKVEVSLPSPTPSSNPVTSGWRPEFAKNPFSRQNATVNTQACDMPGVAATVFSQEKLPTVRLVQPQIPTTSMVVPEHGTTVPPLSQHAISQPSLPQTTTSLPLKRTPPVIPSLRQSAPVNFPNIQMLASEIVLNTNNFAVSSLPSMPVETVKPALVSVTVHTPGALQAGFPSATLLPTPTLPQKQRQPPIIPETRLSTHSWRARQSLASNAHSGANHDNYNAFAGGLVQAPLQPGPPWERNERRGGPEYESWSPDNSPSRSPMNMPGWSYLDPGMNLGHNPRPERSRPWNSSGYRNQSRNENRRWRDRRR